ncbi:GGDEF domain-containing protein [Mycobacterium paraterrae]|uniref:GGDEF domain-containing protein n=1 Tax=Mycobacterium paraterrae TaxID=577492 RepID=A0ABY3VR02_9MYCO|nr:GGDEF domain-containing protein [Mycobacterium paraterrae]UMB69934.1 GGDEF domain-containing protein [Mycobacterium paraterrae]
MDSDPSRQRWTGLDSGNRIRSGISFAGRAGRGGWRLSRRDFRFATAAMREGRMLRVFTRLVAACCFALAGLGVIVQFTPAAPVGVLARSLLLAVTVSAALVALRLLRGPWPRYPGAVAFVVWADTAVGIAAVSMSTPDARLCTTLYLGLVGVYVGFLLGGRILLLHCAFCGALIVGITTWAVSSDHRTVLGLFPVFMPALAWTVAVPVGGLAVIDIGRNSIRRTARSAHYDALTGLRNRRGMHAAVASAVRRSSPASVVIAVCDIDRFKAFNDGEGHAAGDAALMAMARTLRSLAGDTEITARIGGDEFVLVSLVDVRDETPVLLSRLTPLTRGEVDGAELTASVGVAWLPADDPHFSLDDAIRNADEAMYAAKRSGGARCAVYGSATGLGA